MSQSYNKCGPGCVRLGNWQEEKALESLTGVRRCGDPRQSRMVCCSKRVVDHTEHTDPKDYKSTSFQAYAHPATDPNAANRALYTRTAPRAARALASHSAQVRAERAEQLEGERRAREARHLGTISRDSFQRFTPAAMKAAIPVRRVRGVAGAGRGTPAAPASGSDAAADPVYDYLADAAITVWAPGGGGGAPHFGRATRFTNPFSFEGEAWRDPQPVGDAAERGLPRGLSAEAARLVAGMRRRLAAAACSRAHAGGAAAPASVAEVASRIAAVADARGGVDAGDARRALGACGAMPTDAEMEAIVDALACGGGGAVEATLSGGALVALLRAPMAEARLEEVERAWAAAAGADTDCTTAVAADALPGGKAAWEAHAGTDSCLGMAQFAEACWCMSCCCDTDEAFEWLLGGK